MKPETRLATYNIRGLALNTQTIIEFLEELEPHILVVTETFQKPGDSLKIGRPHFSANPEQLSEKDRNRGGVTMIFQDFLRVKLLRRVVQQDYQLITCQLGNTTVIGAYISPNVSAAVWQEILGQIHSSTSGPTVLLGDLNSRHISWDKESNPRGNRLHSWARKYGWKIAAPPEPTFRTTRGGRVRESVIDLMLVKGMKPPEVSVPRGTWRGASDHMPIIAAIPRRAPLLKRRTWISMTERAREETLKEAESVFKRTLPGQAGALWSSTSFEEFTQHLRNTARLFLTPYRESRAHAGKLVCTYWNNELRQLARKRSKAIDRQKWDVVEEVDRIIKRKSRAGNRKCFKEYLSQTPSTDYSTFAKRMKGMMKRKKRRRTENSREGKPLQAKDKARHLRRALARVQGTEVEPRNFIVTGDLRKALKWALHKAPRRKVTGPDRVFSEACW